MYLLKVVELEEIEEYTGVETVVGLYSTQFIKIEKNLITLMRTGAIYEADNPDTVIVPEGGKVYVMDADGNTIDTYWP